MMFFSKRLTILKIKYCLQIKIINRKAKLIKLIKQRINILTFFKVVKKVKKPPFNIHYQRSNFIRKVVINHFIIKIQI
jgi:hypothetical protein